MDPPQLLVHDGFNGRDPVQFSPAQCDGLLFHDITLNEKGGRLNCVDKTESEQTESEQTESEQTESELSTQF